MEIQDGFIVGIFNYCDRWCERCPLTGRCRLFADEKEIDFEQGNGPLTEPRAVRERRRLFAEVAELHERAAELQEPTPLELKESAGRLPADLEPSTGVDPWLLEHSIEVRKKITELELSANPSVRLAMQTIKYFALFVPMKMVRILSQVSREGPGDQQSDANGSGKAALLGLDRMEQAWRSLIESHHVSAAVAAPFLAEIARMQRNINRAVPNARAFIRPGFDEEDEVKMLDAAEC